MIRLIDRIPEGLIPSGISSYNMVNKKLLREKLEKAIERYNNYMTDICNHCEGNRRLNSSDITKYTIEEYLLAKQNKWNLDNRGTIIGHNIRLFEMNKTDIILIPYKDSTPFSLFLPSDWKSNVAKSIRLMIAVADNCILDAVADDVPIGQWNYIWIHEGFENDFTVLSFVVEYYIALFRCLISSSSKINHIDFIKYNEIITCLNKFQITDIWAFAKAIEEHRDTESMYSDTVIAVMKHHNQEKR